MMKNPEKEWFGEEHVTPEEKTGKVIGVFDSVAARYDIMNDLMSGGTHRLWKDRFVRQIRPRSSLKFLDVAGGTGDIAFRIKKKAPNADVTVCDLNEQMLNVGRARAEDKGWLGAFEWTAGNAEALPFPDNSFDVYTIAFGLRNVTHIDTALTEAHRVLRPGGRFCCLEFSHIENPVLAKAYDAFSFALIPKIGQAVARDSESYKYLVESIRRFPQQQELLQRIGEAGLKNASFVNIYAGIVAIHTGFKV